MKNLATTLGKELVVGGEQKVVGGKSLSLAVVLNTADNADNQEVKSPSGNNVVMPVISALLGRPDMEVVTKVEPSLSTVSNALR